MITVDKKEQIFQCSFLIKDNEEAGISVPIGNDTLKTSFSFAPAPEGSEGSIEWKTIDGVLKFSVTGWRNPLGTCTAEPERFGEYNNRKLYFHLSQRLIGSNMNQAHLYFLLGAPNE